MPRNRKSYDDIAEAINAHTLTQIYYSVNSHLQVQRLMKIKPQGDS